jgi:serine phosphatase RsbU (regulator of sigma subunit)
MRFRTLLSLAITIPLLVTAFAVILVMYYNADRRSVETAEKLLASVTSRAAQQVQGRSEAAVTLARTLVVLSERDLKLTDSDALVEQFLGFVRVNPGISWVSYSTPDGTFTGAYRDHLGRICTNQSTIKDGKTALIEYLVPENGARSVLRQNPDSGYDPRNRDFYKQAVASSDIVWLPPYVFYGQNTPGITCAIAIRTPENEVRGVFTVDYNVQTLSMFARDVVASQHSRVMVFTHDKVLVAHSSAQVILTTSAQNSGKVLTMADIPDPATQAFQNHLQRTTLPSPQSTQPTWVRFSDGDTPYLGCILPLQTQSGPPEFVATVAPIHDFAPTAWRSSGQAIIVVVAALLVAAFIATALAVATTNPITALVQISERIGQGELDMKINLGFLKEFKRLAHALDLMLGNLRDWVRVRASLQLTMEIQRNLLPPGPPKLPGFDVAGYSIYCDETGGDYYDYIPITSAPNRLVVALGDVMGHGLPSALLMAGARGILRSSAADDLPPGALLTKLNALLYRDTGGTRFMTMILVCFDCETDGSVWASAGHDSPMVYDPRTKEFYHPEGGDVPLGVVPDVQYNTDHLRKPEPGQIYFVGSDGVWETTSPAGSLYGRKRLKDVIASHADRSADQIKDALLRSLAAFRGAAAPKDDITFVIVKISEPAAAGSAGS